MAANRPAPQLDGTGRQLPGQWHVHVYRRQSARFQQTTLPRGSGSVTVWDCHFLNPSLKQKLTNEEYETKPLHYQ